MFTGFEISKGIQEICKALSTKMQIRWCQMAAFRVTPPIIINIQTRNLLAVETQNYILLFNFE